MRSFFIFKIVLAFVLFGCREVDHKKKGNETVEGETAKVFATPEDQQQYITRLLTFRAEKDSFLKVSKKSPLKRADRRAFRTLNYYEINPNFIVGARLRKNENPPQISIATTTGTNRQAIKYGTLEFLLAGLSHRLTVYKFVGQRPQQEKNYLFVAFTDSTSGRETYGGGRYLDLEENKTGEYLLDFNLVYNPYCAYNESYSCPIPPRENRLSVAVTAGEKVFH